MSQISEPDRHRGEQHAAPSPLPPRRLLVSGNWKMHLTHLDAITLVQQLAFRLDRADSRAIEVSLHPAFTALRSVQVFLEGEEIPLVLGAQDVYFEQQGAFTGEVSAQMLVALDVHYVIVGHSERRRLFGETDEIVNQKLHAVLDAGMIPICCVGDSLEQHERGATNDTVVGQVTAALRGVPAEAAASMVFAYEPLWAIGTGHTAAPEDAQAVCAGIRASVNDLFGAETARAVRIQYGGSVEPDNAAELFAQPDIDGALVGGASLDPDHFAAIVAAGRT
jgi:triosephosphate isomerase